jgi:hypothetical protein
MNLEQHKIVHFNMFLQGSHCKVACSIDDSINLVTGDSIERTSIDEIVTEDDGQMLLPKTLTIDELRAINRRARKTTFI